MPYALRVRLYCGDVLEADTDPDAPGGQPGSEHVATLEASQRALVELCQAMHGPDVQLLGFGPEAERAYGAMMRGRAGLSAQWSYNRAYTVLSDTAERRSATAWLATVDISVLR